MGSIGLELLRQQLVLVHRSHSFVGFRHSTDGRNSADVTGRYHEEADRDMKETISGTYKTTHWREQEYSKLEHGPRLTLAEREATVDGGIQGKGVLRYSIVQLADGSSRFT